jgi:hypothetical protein
MHLTIKALREGTSIATYWQAGFATWRELLRDIGTVKIGDLAARIGEAQLEQFERRCGGRALGQEIMAWTGVAYFFDAEEGNFGDDVERARKIFDALQLSHASIEVKVHAERAAITYDLLEDVGEVE